MSGRWFTGAYDEIGLDVHPDRASAAIRSCSARGQPSLQDGDVRRRRCGSSARTCRPRCAPRDVDLGQGVTVTRVVSATPDDDHGRSGRRGRRADRRRATSSSPAPSSRRRSSSTTRSTAIQGDAAGRHGARRRRDLPEAVRSSSRPSPTRTAPDGKPDTRTTSTLGLVDADVERSRNTRRRSTTTTRSSSATIDADGAVHAERSTARIPKRTGNRNNVGDVWVVATLHADRGARHARPLRARAHLLVTVPLYMRWDSSRGAADERARARRLPPRSRPPAAASSISCRARPCSRSTTCRRRCCDARRRAAADARRARRRRCAIASTPTDVDETHRRAAARCARSADVERADAPAPKILPLDAVPADDDGAERHQPVQPELHLLLRVRRGQDRRHRERQAAEVHERGDGARERRVPAAGVGRNESRT